MLFWIKASIWIFLETLFSFVEIVLQQGFSRLIHEFLCLFNDLNLFLGLLCLYHIDLLVYFLFKHFWHAKICLGPAFEGLVLHLLGWPLAQISYCLLNQSWCVREVFYRFSTQILIVIIIGWILRVCCSHTRQATQLQKFIEIPALQCSLISGTLGLVGIVKLACEFGLRPLLLVKLVDGSCFRPRVPGKLLFAIK